MVEDPFHAELLWLPTDVLSIHLADVPHGPWGISLLPHSVYIQNPGRVFF